MSATSAVVLNAQSLNHWRQHPVEFIETVLCNPETGQPFELLPAERAFLDHALQIGPDGKLIFTSGCIAVRVRAVRLRFKPSSSS